MGLFSHKKKDSIVGPSGYAYTDESGEEPLTDRHRRHSSNSSSTHSPRRSVDQPTRTSQDVSTRKSVDHGDRNLAGVGAAAATAPVVGSAMAGRKSLDNENDVNKSRRDEQFISGVLPQTQAQATPVVPAQVQPNVGSSGGRLSEGQRLKVVETAKAPHAHPGREKDSVLSEEDAKNAEHDHKYLEPVVHERIHRHHVEEIETHRSVQRHVHHIQHHIQPIVDEQHSEEVHLFREVPVTSIKENHAMSAEDKALFERLNIGAGTTTIIPHEKVVVNKGETMRTETIIHHVHHIVQPIWQRDLHEYFRLNPPNPAHAAPYSSSYTGPGSLGTAYYPETGAATTSAHHPNPASIAVQHGQASSVGGSIPHGGVQVKEGHQLVPIEGSRHEIHYVNREPVQTVATGSTEVFPTRQPHEASVLSQTSTAPYQTSTHGPSSSIVGHAGPTAAAGHSAEAEQGMRNLSLGVAQ
ncbi:hypothetical protein JCM16303_007354 [Sporobolomyces ruberrimus]